MAEQKDPNTPSSGFADIVNQFAEAEKFNTKNKEAQTVGYLSGLKELGKQGYYPDIAVGAGVLLGAKAVKSSYNKLYKEELGLLRKVAQEEKQFTKTVMGSEKQPFVYGKEKDLGNRVRLTREVVDSGARGNPAFERTPVTSTNVPRLATAGEKGVSQMTNKEIQELAKRNARSRLTSWLSPVPQSVASTRTPAMIMEGFQMGGQGPISLKFNPEMYAKGSTVYTPPVMPQKLPVRAMEGIARGTQYLGEKYGQLMNNPFVKYPLRVLETVKTPYNMYQQYDAEVARAEAEGSDFAQARGVGRGLGPLARTGINLTTAYVPEMLGLYESPEDLGKMYTSELNRIDSEFVKKNKRPMTDEERQNYQDALMMSGIGFGG